MSVYHVIIMAPAQRDVLTIFAWLHKRSPTGASRWMAAFEAANTKLSEDPLRHALIPEKLRVPYEARDILFKTRKGRIYRTVFTVIGNDVRILRVRRPAQRPLRGRDLPKL